MEGITEEYQINEIHHLPSSNQLHKTENHHFPLNELNKRPFSDTSSLVTVPSSPPVNISSNEANDTNFIRSRNITKKAKVDRSRSISPSKTTDKLSAGLKPAEDLFPNNSSITLCQFKYVIENYTNKNLNIHNICKDINSDISSLMLLTEQIRPKVTDRSTKTQLTRLANFLFQALPPPQDN